MQCCPGGAQWTGWRNASTITSSPVYIADVEAVCLWTTASCLYFTATNVWWTGALCGRIFNLDWCQQSFLVHGPGATGFAGARDSKPRPQTAHAAVTKAASCVLRQPGSKVLDRLSSRHCHSAALNCSARVHHALPSTGMDHFSGAWKPNNLETLRRLAQRQDRLVFIGRIAALPLLS
jgi:hypothetical protein